MQLHFYEPLVRRIYEHSKVSKKHKPTVDQTYQGEYRFDGKTLDSEEVYMNPPTAADVDFTKIPPGLWLVGGKGVFLMSNGAPGLILGSGPGHVVAHAIEADPLLGSNWRDITKRLFGPLYGLELLEAPFIEAMFAKTENSLVGIRFSSETLDSAVPSFSRSFADLRSPRTRTDNQKVVTQ